MSSRPSWAARSQRTHRHTQNHTRAHTRRSSPALSQRQHTWHPVETYENKNVFLRTGDNIRYSHWRTISGFTRKLMSRNKTKHVLNVLLIVILSFSAWHACLFISACLRLPIYRSKIDIHIPLQAKNGRGYCNWSIVYKNENYVSLKQKNKNKMQFRVQQLWLSMWEETKVWLRPHTLSFQLQLKLKNIFITELSCYIFSSILTVLWLYLYFTPELYV